MMGANNTRERSDALQAAARAFLTARGLDVTRQTVPIRAWAPEFAQAQGCHLDTAKRHLAKAARRMRGETVPTAGGHRKNAGRPAGTKGSKMFYAVEYKHGRTTVNGEVRLHEFDDRQARDAWVAAGEPSFTSGGYREALPASDRRVRAARAEEAAHGPGAFAHTDA